MGEGVIERSAVQGERMRMLKDESAVSLVVGALLLILIVVVSASALGFMVSEAQKKEMERKSHLQAVESENLKILSLELKDSGNGYWDNVTINIANLNTEESKISTISINDRSAANYTDGEQTYDYLNRLTVPAAESKKLFLDFSSNLTSPLRITYNQPIKVLIFTGLTNKFEEVFLPPLPLIKVSVESQYINGNSEVLVLDGGDSIHYKGTIVGYQWHVDNGSTLSTDLTGQKARMNFNQTQTGSFWVNLTVKDSNGMTNSARWDSP